MVVASLACSGSAPGRRTPPRTAAPSPSAPAPVTSSAGSPTPIALQRQHVERMRGTRAELEAIVAEKGGGPERTAEALLGLALIDLEAEEAAWDGPDPEVNAARARGGAIARLRRLLADFPGSRRRDDALYLLGIALRDHHDDAGALAAFQQLIRERPASRHLAEVWFRIGEIHFDAADLTGAALAYERAQAQPDRSMAVLALYKLGWTHYRADRYASAVDAFDRLLAGALPAAEVDLVRSEAVQYVALSLIEPDWDGDGAPDPAPSGAVSASVARVAGRVSGGAIAREVAEAAADALAADAREAEARAVYDLLLAATADAASRARLTAKRARVP